MSRIFEILPTYHPTFLDCIGKTKKGGSGNHFHEKMNDELI